MMQESELNKKRQMANEVGALKEETDNKVDFYKEVLKAEGNLLSKLEKRQDSFFVRPIIKLREHIEIVNLHSSITNKTKVFESYLMRKKTYENWIDEMALEVNEKFDEVWEKAKEVKTNMRLSSSLETYEKKEKETGHSIEEKIEFYLYLNQELLNKKKYKRK